MMREDFCIFILTHGRPDNVLTLTAIRKAGYTGKAFLVIDDEDKAGHRYREKYGDSVLVFSKQETAKTFDICDGIPNRNSVVYARNATFDLARQVGCRYFMQLDDDYTSFSFRRDEADTYGTWTVRSTFDGCLEALIEFYDSIPALSIAISQGGDWRFGDSVTSGLSRKAMNSFLCSVDRPFKFIGRMNDDVNTYVALGSRGHLFFTVFQLMLVQKQTQAQAGGLTEMYLDHGTYTKSFYTVMLQPSSVRIGTLGKTHERIHHDIAWSKTVPRILRPAHRKPDNA